MTQLTQHFKLSEFGLEDTDALSLRENARRVAFELEIIRRIADAPIIITSGFRDQAHNMKVGGSETSMHLHALAADFYAEGWSTSALADHITRFIPLLRFDQMIFYTGHVHLGLSLETQQDRRNVYYKR